MFYFIKTGSQKSDFLTSINFSPIKIWVFDDWRTLKQIYRQKGPKMGANPAFAFQASLSGGAGDIEDTFSNSSFLNLTGEESGKIIINQK